MTVYSLQNKRKKTDKQTKQNADIGKEIKKPQINLIQIAVTKKIYIKYHLYLNLSHQFCNNIDRYKSK